MIDVAHHKYLIDAQGDIFSDYFHLCILGSRGRWSATLCRGILAACKPGTPYHLSAQKSDPKKELHAGYARWYFRPHCELNNGSFRTLQLAYIARRIPSVSQSEHQGRGFESEPNDPR
jgi:hypothetical protein